MTKIHWLLVCLVVVGSAYCMSSVYRAAHRLLTTMASEYVSGTHSMAFVTAPNEEVAKKLARGLVENKLAACVNIIPAVKSIYVWKGNVEEDSELLLMIKTRTSRVDELSKYVREHHPAEVAEVISSPIQNGNAPYLQWLGESVPEVKSDN